MSFDESRGYANGDRERFMGRDDHRQLHDHGDHHGHQHGQDHRGPYGQGSYGASSSSNQYSRGQGQAAPGYDGRDSFSNGSYTRHDEHRGQQGSNNERSWGGQYARDHNDRDWSRGAQHGSSSYGHQQYGHQQDRNEQYGNQQYRNEQYGNQQYGNQQYGNQQYGNRQYGNQQYGHQQYSNQYGGRGSMIDERGYAAAYYGDDRAPLDDDSELGAFDRGNRYEPRALRDERSERHEQHGHRGYRLDRPVVPNERGTWSSDMGERDRFAASRARSYGPPSYEEGRGGYGSSRGLDDTARRFHVDDDRGSFAQNSDGRGFDRFGGMSRFTNDDDDNGRFLTSNEEGSGTYRSASSARAGFHGSSNRDLPHHERDRRPSSRGVIH